MYMYNAVIKGKCYHLQKYMLHTRYGKNLERLIPSLLHLLSCNVAGQTYLTSMQLS